MNEKTKKRIKDAIEEIEKIHNKLENDILDIIECATEETKENFNDNIPYDENNLSFEDIIFYLEEAYDNCDKSLGCLEETMEYLRKSIKAK